MCKILEKRRASSTTFAEEELSEESNIMSKLGFDFSCVPEEESDEYYERLRGLIQKEFDVHWDVNWELLSDVGLEATVDELLTQRYNKPQPNDGTGDDYYDYMDWFELVVIKDAYIFRNFVWSSIPPIF
ncbi:uncharacterized protein [Rutidosis leptorrhynchoides]|uniref:uncharacterized protein isoform X2 n=1 Tax=Rutidosis leptorrhynchoides TaxID=125765 RepID=UPI003A99F970